MSSNKKSYEELEKIGNGAYGTVYRARDLTNNGQMVALKKVLVPITEDGVPMSTMREIALLKQLDKFEHPNIVRLLDICNGARPEKDHQMVLYLVFEHIDQDLTTYLERNTLSLKQTRSIFKQLLCGIDFLHSHRIVHRDLKPQNLLVTSDGNLKLADFGLAKTYDFEMRLTSVVVTLWYRAPEVLLGLPYATPVDLWAAGCILVELFKRQPLFCGSSEADQLNRIFQVIGTPSEKQWPENVSLLRSSFTTWNSRPLMLSCPDAENLAIQLLKFDDLKRPTAIETLRHRFFRPCGEEVNEPVIG